MQVGNVEGDVAGIVTAILAEHGPDRRGKNLDVGHHHHHLARRQRLPARWRGQQRQQLVVQDLHLALGAVAEVEDDRPIGRVGRPQRMLGQRQQVADAGLQGAQQALAGAVVEQVDARDVELPAAALRIVEGIELAHEIAPLPAPGRQQRVGMLVHLGQRQGPQRQAAPQAMARLGGTQQFAPVQDVGPVIAAGVGDGQQHLGLAGERGQGLQRLARQMRGAEQHQPPGQGLHRRLATRQRRQKGLVHLRPGRQLLGRA